MLRLCVLFLTFGLCWGFNINNIPSVSNFFNDFTSKLEGFINDSNTSLRCKQQLKQYKTSLNKKELWAMQMFDASGKIPSGILQGYFTELGAFDQCMNIKHQQNGSEIIGKYCLADVPIIVDSNQNNINLKQTQRRPLIPPNFQLGVCGPSSCTASELQSFYGNLLKNIKINEAMCQSKETRLKFNPGTIATVCFFAVVLGAIIISTIYEMAIGYLRPGTESHILLTSFSLWKNGKSFLTTSNNPKQISCLHGMRLISAMWILFGHRFSVALAMPVRNKFFLFQYLQNEANMFTHQFGLAVDTFLLLSGLVVTYGYFNSISKDARFNILTHYLHRILRLTPMVAIMIVIYLTIFIHLGDGPVWPKIISPLKEGCEVNWWRTLFFINNYGRHNWCVSHTWYLSVDMQLFILSPFILISLSKWPKYTFSFICFLILVSMAVCFYVTWYFQISAIQMSVHHDMSNFMYGYYNTTHTRTAPWLIGVILGYMVFHAKQGKVHLTNKTRILLLWVATLIVLPTCVFAGHNLVIGTSYSWVANAFHIALVRPVWACAVSWVIYASVIGYGGIINQFLSLSIFEVLGKLTYIIYMTHLFVMYITSAQMRIVPIVNNFEEMHHFWGDFALTVALSIVLFLGIERPIACIEAFVFRKDMPKVIPKESTKSQDP